MIARQLIAERCLYGVDLNPLAVELAKLSIWLVTLAKGRPFGFLDHNLRSGNSLLGIHLLDQLTQLSIVPSDKGQIRLMGQQIERAVSEAINLRQKLRALPIRDIRDVEAMAQLDADARKMLEVPQLIADAFIGEVFASGGNANVLVNATASLATQAEMAIDGEIEAIELIAQRTVLAFETDTPSDKPRHKPFHWPLEFPEVFNRAKGGFDGMVGNPPFLGGQRITGVAGTAFRDWLVNNIADGRRGSADLVAYFFLRVWILLREGGGFGMLAVNTISEGDTRRVGLEAMVNEGAVIYAAYPNEPWPGKAAVVTSRVHVHRGEWRGARILLGQPAPFISAFLSDREEWSPKRLKANEGIAFQGSIVLGMGFVLSHDQVRTMLDVDSTNADVLLPYINGDDLNSDPSQQPSRWVINFWDWPEERAREYEMPWRWIEERVKPERQRRKSNGEFALRSPLPDRWWQFGEKRPGLYHAIGRGHYFERHPTGWDPSIPIMKNVSICSQVSKHFGIHPIPNDVIFDQRLVVHRLIARDAILLQSSIFIAWVLKFGSTLETRMTYTPSDCFETFPRPNLKFDDWSNYFDLRIRLCVEEGMGMGKIYNRFHSEVVSDPLFKQFRCLQEELDKAVVHAYGWDDLDLGHGFHPLPHLQENDRVRFTISESARVEVLRRLAEMNRQRYQEEVQQALHGGNEAHTKQVPRSIVTVAALQPSFDFGGADASQELKPTAAKTLSSNALTDNVILGFLKKNAGWHAKAFILSVTKITDQQWNTAIVNLISQSKVERQGERRATRYRAVGGDM
jgi:hypothetical protein